MPRIVVAASPLSGHVLPMVLIAEHLHRVGHQVVMLTDEGHRSVVERRGLSFEALDAAACVAAPPPSSVLNRLLPNLFRRYLLGRTDVRSTFIAPLGAQHRSLQRVLDGYAADAVLVDLAFTGVLPLLGAHPRPAVLVCGVGPITLTSADTPPFGMAWAPREGTDYRGMHAVVNRVLFRGIGNALDNALRAAGGSECPVPLMDWPRLADRLVQLAVAGFEYPRRDLPPGTEFVGPVLPQSAGSFDEPPWWRDMLAAPTVVHVTQGTLDNADLDQVIGPTLDAFADDENVFVVATSGGRAGQRLSSRIPSNAVVTEWVPYSALLPHVDVMITNGGYGGVQHALSYGIPVIVAGESSDKSEIGARVAYTGVGINLATAHPTAVQIAAAVRSVTDRHREAAHRLGDAVARCTPLESIAGVVDEELSRQRSTPKAG